MPEQSMNTGWQPLGCGYLQVGCGYLQAIQRSGLMLGQLTRIARQWFGRLVHTVNLAPPYPSELLRVARKVVWYDPPEHTLADLNNFLAHLMVYGSSADVAVAERHVPAEEFRRVLENAPAGVFSQDVWRRWHERFAMPLPPLPRRQFPDGSFGPEPGVFFGR